MKNYNFGYLIKQGIRNIWTNRILSFTSIAVLTTCLIFVGSAYLFTLNVDNMLGYMQEQNEMVVFLYDVEQEQREAQIESANDKISDIDNVRSLEYISKEQGLEQTREEWGDQAYLLDGFEDRNTIPDSFIIKIKDLEQTDQTIAQLEGISEIEIVKASTDTASTLTQVSTVVNTFGYALIIALGVISMVIISNTIKATIFTRRKEINIMKYVGATNNFIKTPFVVEGFIIGVISAVFALAIIWGSYEVLIEELTITSTVFLNELYQNIIPFDDISLDLSIAFLITGAVIGTVGSSISTKKYTKV